MKKYTGNFGGIFKHTFIYSISSVLQKSVGFIMLPIYANYLGAEGYGIVGMIDVVTSALTVFIGFGITGAMYRFYHEKTTETEQKTLVSTALVLMFSLVLVCSLPFFLFSKELALLAFGKDGLEDYLILGLLTFVFEMGSASASGYIFIRQQSIFFTALSLMRLVVGLTMNILLIVIAKMGVLGVLYSNLLTTVLFFAVVQSYAFRHVGFSFSRPQALAILRYSVPMFPGYVAMFLRNNADRILLSRYLGLGHLGIYSMLLKFSSLVSVFLLTPFLNVWNNRRFELCQQDDGAQALARVFTLHLALMFFFGLVLSLQIPLLLRMLTPQEFWVPGAYAYLAVVAVILSASYYHFQFGMSYAKATGKISMVQIYTAVVSVVSNLLLIKLYGLPGALVSSCFVYTFQCVLAYHMSKRYFRIPFEWNKIFKIVASATSLFIVINPLSIGNSGIIVRVFGGAPAVLASTFRWLHLHQFRDGKLLTYVLDNFPLVIDGVFKLILSFLFVLVLILLGVLSKEQVLKSLQAVNVFKAGKRALA